MGKRMSIPAILNEGQIGAMNQALIVLFIGLYDRKCYHYIKDS